jgi:5-methyltetrahydropteroyltriglutamate--homocysteine methyltransferase
MNLAVTDQLLPITMVGSYPRPLWYRHQLSGRDLLEAFKLEEHAQAFEDAVASVIRDQELAGLDVVSDGQMHFDDYGGSIGSFTWYWYERLRGFDPAKLPSPIAAGASAVDADILDNWGGVLANGRAGPGPIRLDTMYRLAARHARRPVKVCVGAGPLNLPIHVDYAHPGSAYSDSRALTEDLVPIFNAEMRSLVASGARMLQLDDLGAWLPVMTGNDSDSDFVVDVVNRTLEGVEAKIAWHFCLGNAYGNSNVSVWGGMLERILPPLYATVVDQFVLDFALRDMRDVGILSTLPADKEVAAGVVDVRTLQVESAEQIAERMRKVLEVVPAAQVWFTTDCGLRALPRFVAFEKLKSLRAGVEIVRAEVQRA